MDPRPTRKGSWRDEARLRIYAIVTRLSREGRGRDMNALRTALRIEYPWPPRKHLPYKAWREEARWALGIPQQKVRDRQDSEAELFLWRSRERRSPSSQERSGPGSASPC